MGCTKSSSEKEVYSVKALVTQLCPTLCESVDCNPPGSSVHGILQARILEWGATAFSRGSSPPRYGVFNLERWKWKSLCCVLTLCDPMDYTVHGILQARILEWVTIPFSRGSSQPRNWTKASCIAGRFFTSWATRENIPCIGCLCCFCLGFL